MKYGALSLWGDMVTAVICIVNPLSRVHFINVEGGDSHRMRATLGCRSPLPDRTTASDLSIFGVRSKYRSLVRADLSTFGARFNYRPIIFISHVSNHCFLSTATLKSLPIVTTPFSCLGILPNGKLRAGNARGHYLGNDLPQATTGHRRPPQATTGHVRPNWTHVNRWVDFLVGEGWECQRSLPR